MANFVKALKKTLTIEGGYVDDPRDAGGETFRGISRKNNPGWNGWSLIDRIKSKCEKRNDFREALNENSTLEGHVESFYKQHYWDRFWGDKIFNQEIAEELFDTSVNMGVHRAVTFLQKALNLLNGNQERYHDIVEDGVFGAATEGAIRFMLSSEKEDATNALTIMNTLQGMHYIHYATEHPEQERFMRGWLKRVRK